MEKYKELFGGNEYWFEIDFRDAEDFLNHLSEWGCRWQNGDEIDRENDCVAYTHYAISPKGLVHSITEIEWALSNCKVRKRNFKKFCEIIYRFERDCRDAYENDDNWLYDGVNDKKILKIEENEKKEENFKRKVTNTYSVYGNEIWFEVSFDTSCEFLSRLKKLRFKWKNGDEIDPHKSISCVNIGVMKKQRSIYYLTEEKWNDERLKVIEKIKFDVWLRESKFKEAGNFIYPKLPRGMCSHLSPEYKEYAEKIRKAEKYL
ncbi:MAG: hypothetical protein J6B79_03150 [Clostridia bacterium]|nr:hypothetical protein [Clostridia bacterium]